MAKLSVVQIQQTIGQLEASIGKAEDYLSQDEFEEYCDNIAGCVTKWRVILKATKEKEKQ